MLSSWRASRQTLKFTVLLSLYIQENLPSNGSKNKLVLLFFPFDRGVIPNYFFLDFNLKMLKVAEKLPRIPGWMCQLCLLANSNMARLPALLREPSHPHGKAVGFTGDAWRLKVSETSYAAD